MPISCVEFDYSELRGRIRTYCGTEGKFAEMIGRTHQFVSSVFNDRTFFEPKDILNACDVLDIPNGDIGFFFYTQKVHKCEQNGE